MTQRILTVLLLLVFAVAPALADDRRALDTAGPGSDIGSEPGPHNLRLADPRVLDRLRAADLANPGLPRHMTDHERRIWELPEPSELSPEDMPDYTFLRPPAEYENNEAILMRWGWPEAVLTSMIVPITTGDSLAEVKLVVSGPSEEASAASTLNSAGADLDRGGFRACRQ